MKYYYVTIFINLGDYEKYNHVIVQADSREDAEYQALCDETHNTPLTREEFDNCDDWWDDYMLYSIYSCKEISKDVADQL